MRNRLGRALDALAVATLGFYLAVAVPWSLLRSGDELSQAARSHETLQAARLRVHGAVYTRGIDEIRRQLPLDQAYLLVEAGKQRLGGAYWVRYDLAPRRAIFLGREVDLTDPGRVRKRLTANLRQVVISYGPKLAPRLLPRYVFVQEVERRHRSAPSGLGAPPSPAASAPHIPAAAPAPPGRPAGPPPGRPAER